MIFMCSNQSRFCFLSSRKRQRSADSDYDQSLPISKRINQLHIRYFCPCLYVALTVNRMVDRLKIGKKLSCLHTSLESASGKHIKIEGPFSRKTYTNTAVCYQDNFNCLCVYVSGLL